MRKSFFYILLLIFAASSCKKDPQVSQHCYENANQSIFELSQNNGIISYDTLCHSPFGWTIEYPDNYLYMYPCFNPTNPNQICYLNLDARRTGGQSELWTYDFCTGEKKLLTWGVALYPKWSVKNWIVFTAYDHQLWKIKANGDSLTQLTNNFTYNNYASWNEDGTKLIYLFNDSVLILNESGARIGGFAATTGFGNFVWFSAEKAYSCTGNSILTVNIVDGTVQTLYSFSATSAPYFVNSIVVSNGTVFWANSYSVNYLDGSGVNYTIKTGGENRSYANFDVSNDGKTILVSRIDDTVPQPCIEEGRQNLYMMDVQGNQERKIAFSN